MNRPREGNVPGQPVHDESDSPDNRHSLERKVESGLAEPRRDTATARYLAKLNGWSDEEYKDWVMTGEVPAYGIADRACKGIDANDDDEVLKR